MQVASDLVLDWFGLFTLSYLLEPAPIHSLSWFLREERGEI